MTTARALIVAADAPGIYHCVQRCVRRAFLCGFDHHSRRSFEHRKDWIEQRLLVLSDCFAVAVHGYAVMSNHLHLVVQLDPQAAAAWSDAEVARRWVTLFPPCEDSEAARSGKQQAIAGDAERLQRCRRRLSALPWLMRCLAEPIARRANREDQVTGRFWQGRYRCQVLLDERAVLAALAYVDLNPIRAGVVDRIEDSAHTSVQRRMVAAEQHPEQLAQPLRALAGLQAATLPLSLSDYLELLDWTGRQLRPGKRGAIAVDAPPILQKFGIQPIRWSTEVRGVGSDWYRAIGSAGDLLQLARELGQCWLRGVGFARALGLN